LGCIFAASRYKFELVGSDNFEYGFPGGIAGSAPLLIFMGKKTASGVGVRIMPLNFVLLCHF